VWLVGHTTSIYVGLLDEGVTVYRPVEAEPEPDGAFRLPLNPPDDETWLFAPRSRVYCEWRDLYDGRVLVADRQAP